MSNTTKPTNADMNDLTHGSLTPCDAIPFDNFEVQGVIRRRWTISVDDTEAEYWTIMGYISGKQICGIGRFATRSEAEKLSATLYRHGNPTDR